MIHVRTCYNSSKNQKDLNMKNSLGSVVAAAVSFASLLTGCPNPNIYGTPRTIPKGEIQHTVAIEGIGAFGGATTSTNSSGTTSTSTSAYLPSLPTYQLRYGVAERFDLGVRLGNLSLLGVDGKWNFVKGRVDLAVNPGVQGTYFAIGDSSAAILYGNLPLLVGINFTPRIAMLLSPGIGFAAAVGGTASGSNAKYTGGSGFLTRIGGGFNFKVSDTFAVQPEVTALWNPSSTGVILSTGVGLTFGSQPDTSDLK